MIDRSKDVPFKFPEAINYETTIPDGATVHMIGDGFAIVSNPDGVPRLIDYLLRDEREISVFEFVEYLNGKQRKRSA